LGLNKEASNFGTSTVESVLFFSKKVEPNFMGSLFDKGMPNLMPNGFSAGNIKVDCDGSEYFLLSVVVDKPGLSV
jgi:hypothetical protein